MENPRVKWLINCVRGERILNVGFIGKGEDGTRLHKAFKKRNKKAFLVGVDINQELLLKFREENTLAGDAYFLPFDNKSFDTVVLGEVIEHFFDITGLIREVSRVLKPKGKLYLTTPSPYALFRWLKHWLLIEKKRMLTKENTKGFLGDDDHKVIWEPLSLVNLLEKNKLKVTVAETKVLAFPYFSFLREADLSFWPFNRLGEYLCLIGVKQ